MNKQKLTEEQLADRAYIIALIALGLSFLSFMLSLA